MVSIQVRFLLRVDQDVENNVLFIKAFDKSVKFDPGYE